MPSAPTAPEGCAHSNRSDGHASAGAETAAKLTLQLDYSTGQITRTPAAMRKLIIQIPCLNEEESLPVMLADLPREVPGYEVVEWLVIDDGSTDNTVSVARENGVDHIVSLGSNRGLATAFMAGLEACLRRGAHTIVNMDADNQYRGDCVAGLCKPILEDRAQIVIGARPIRETKEFSLIKRWLQRLGSWAVRIASGTDIPDAPSGFRAIGRDAAMQMTVFSAYTYTLETIIQAGRKGITITSVPVETNAALRPSRLVPSISKYVWRSLVTIFRIFVLYKPARFFAIIAALVFVPALLAVLRFLFFFAVGEGTGHVQSLVLAAGLMGVAAILFVAGILADLISANRRLLEDIRVRVIRAELSAPIQKTYDHV